MKTLLSIIAFILMIIGIIGLVIFIPLLIIAYLMKMKGIASFSKLAGIGFLIILIVGIVFGELGDEGYWERTTKGSSDDDFVVSYEHEEQKEINSTSNLENVDYITDDTDFTNMEEAYQQYILNHLESIGLIEYIENGRYVIDHVEIDETEVDGIVQRNYTYYLNATLNIGFQSLTDDEKIDVLANLTIVDDLHFADGHSFIVGEFILYDETDHYVRTAYLLERNGEKIW